ncbi:MAG: hypothetical protein Q6K99_09075 [Thermostichales cyanobacterium BF4_bins_65]
MPDPDPQGLLSAVEKRLQALQQQVQDLRTLEQLESMPLVQLQALNHDLDALEARLHQYLVRRTQPSLFWQVVRFVGLGIVIGMAAQAWLQR